MSKFKVGDKVRVVRNNGDDFDGIKIGDTGEVVEICKGKYPIYLKINNHAQYAFKEEELELYDEYFVGGNKMELTFKEVIANIKENEVWECTRKDARVKKIRMVNDLLVFDYGDTITEKQSAIRGTDTFKLQRKEYTFEEAFKAYEEGKEIESGSYKYKKCNGADCFKLIRSIKDEWIKCEDGFEIHLDEIRGKWYIND